VVAVAAIAPGTDVAAERVTARDPIPFGHKMATRAIAKGEPVLASAARFDSGDSGGAKYTAHAPHHPRSFRDACVSTQTRNLAVICVRAKLSILGDRSLPASSPRKRGSSIPGRWRLARRLWNTGSPACAGDDGRCYCLRRDSGFASCARAPE
jgi:hypothetical protein